jgi:adenylate cyclase
VNVPDAYADPDFDRDIDLRSGFRTRNMLCVPLHDRSGQLFALGQMLNKTDGRPFTTEDEQRFQEFAGPLAVILESCRALMGRDGVGEAAVR